MLPQLQVESGTIISDGLDTDWIETASLDDLCGLDAQTAPEALVQPVQRLITAAQNHLEGIKLDPLFDRAQIAVFHEESNCWFRITMHGEKTLGPNHPGGLVIGGIQLYGAGEGCPLIPVEVPRSVDDIDANELPKLGNVSLTRFTAEQINSLAESLGLAVKPDGKPDERDAIRIYNTLYKMLIDKTGKYRMIQRLIELDDRETFSEPVGKRLRRVFKKVAGRLVR
jgi:hypothetical protein